MTEEDFGSQIFGVIADVQYVDAEDGTTFDGKTVRKYRQSLDILKSAVEHFSKSEISFFVVLGDIIDSKSKILGQEKKCLGEVMSTLNRFTNSYHLTIGNHDISALSRDLIHSTLLQAPVQEITSPTAMYYAFTHPGINRVRFIVLDGYDVSTISPSSVEGKQKALEILRAKNKNLFPLVNGTDWARGDWFGDLSKEDMRFVPYNGAVGDEQLAWFDAVLRAARDAAERCFVFCHMPCFVNACRPGGLLWNSEQLLAIMYRYQGTVAAVISGHDHDGGFAIDSTGIAHVVPPAPLECAEGQVSFGTIQVHAGHFVLSWVGKIPDRELYPEWPVDGIVPYPARV